MSVPPTLLRSCAAVLLLATGLGAQPATTPLFWPDRTGPTNDGIVPAAEAARLPLEWDAATGKNIVWKTELEGEGHSTPVIGGDRLWFTSATEAKSRCGSKGRRG